MSQPGTDRVNNGGIRGFFLGLGTSLGVGFVVALIVYIVSDISGPTLVLIAAIVGCAAGLALALFLAKRGADDKDRAH